MRVRTWLSAALAAALGLTLAAAPAGAAGPPTTIPGAAPGGHVVIGRHIEKIAASNQGWIKSEAGVQLYDGKGAIWVKTYSDANEVGARFSSLHYQELDSAWHVTQEYRGAAARGPTHRTTGGKTVYYVGKFRPVHPRTVYFRVSVKVWARKSGTWLETSSPKGVCSYMVDRAHGYVVIAPLC